MFLNGITGSNFYDMYDANEEIDMCDDLLNWVDIEALVIKHCDLYSNGYILTFNDYKLLYTGDTRDAIIPISNFNKHNLDAIYIDVCSNDSDELKDRILEVGFNLV